MTTNTAVCRGLADHEYGDRHGGTLQSLRRRCAQFCGDGTGTLPIILSGSEEQKKRWLPDIAAGKKLAAFALTEPQAGSDAGAVRTTAIRDGDHYVMNGTKQWITNGGEAEIYSVIALTNPAKGPRGASCIVVEKGTPGFTFGKKEDKLGIRASATRELIFQDCRVPVENCLGREGTGFITAMRTFDVSRPGVGAQAVGIAPGAFDLALEYACTRRQFGSPGRLVPGTALHAGRHGHEDRSRARAGLRHGALHRYQAQGAAHALLRHVQVLCLATWPWKSPSTPCRFSAATATCTITR